MDAHFSLELDPGSPVPVAAPVPASAPVLPTDRSPDRLRVLLVEDNPEYVRLVDRALAAANGTIELSHVRTLGAALDRQERDPADVVLLDLGLPDSPEAKTRQHARHLARTAPIVVLTAQDDGKSALDALAAGVEDYFIKEQLDPSTLSAVLRAAVLRRRAGQGPATATCLDAEAFRAELRRSISSLEGSGALTLTYIELDYFDVLRELWGEPWAQRMLRSVSDSLLATAAPGAFVARLGEGAFAVLCCASSTGPVLDLASLEGDLSMSPDVSHRERYSVTASYGTASIPEDGRHPANLIACAAGRAREAFHRSMEGPRFRLEAGERSGVGE